VLVTGGAKGIGAATAKRFASEGATVVVADFDETAAQETAKGTFFAVRAAQKHMVEQKSGKMVLISSTSALGNRGQTNYATAKAGLQGMTKTLAIELGPFNVNVNCVAPGFIATAMTHQTADRMGVPFEQFAAAVSEQVPLKRVGQPEDVAGTIAFLCSEDASYVSGQVIYVAGGPKN
jgi:3-oxoacyl-[acyl-carrier protein] reductase